MKGLSIILNVVLLVAVIILFVLHFNGKKPIKTTSVNKVNTDTVNQQSASNLPIAIIDTDTIWSQYGYTKDLEDKYASKQRKMQNALERKYKVLEEDMVEFQEKVQKGTFLSEQRAYEEQERLQAERMELMNYEQTMNQELMEDRTEMTKKVYDSIVNYLGEFNSLGKYEYVFSKAYCLYNEESVDITDTVLNVMNRRYDDYTEGLLLLSK